MDITITTMLWLLSPLLSLLLLPCLIYVILFTMGIIINVTSKYNVSKQEYFFKKTQHWVSRFWCVYGRVYHGYEVEGLDNIPDEGPALIVYYHGVIPIDMYYLQSEILLEKGRLVCPSVDRWMLKLPVVQLGFKIMGLFGGTREACIEILEKGDLVSVAPGGAKEALFGGDTYKLMWGQRRGFAEVAVKAKVPIIPMFTVNLREAYSTPSFGQTFFMKIYEMTRLPLVPIYGGLLVKLKTIVGKPLPFDPSLSSEEVAKNTAKAIENLVKANQRIPGSLTRALMDRFS